MFPTNVRYGAKVGSFMVNDVMYCWSFETGFSIMFPCVSGAPLLMTAMFEV